MSKKEKDDAIKSQTQGMAEAAKMLNGLTKKRQEVLSTIREKDTSLHHSFSKTINDMREAERKKRLELYGEVEEQRQQATSTAMLELIQICEKDTSVPPYILAIAKVLDNYQGESLIYL